MNTLKRIGDKIKANENIMFQIGTHNMDGQTMINMFEYYQRKQKQLRLSEMILIDAIIMKGQE